ncbi:MAG: trimethylamine methyltransferase [Candidatus Glassbacteria bacterium]|nr:trimethylamine methyltransferase [Candidatus Glassbacteria bacterium]
MPKETVQGGRLKLLSDDDVGQIHAAALRILEQAGIRIPHAQSLAILRDAGAKAGEDEETVYLQAGLVENALRDAPSEVLLCGRERHNDLLLAGNNVYAGTGGAELNVLDLETGRLRESTLRDVADIARLVDALDGIDFYIRPVVARDVPHEKLDVNKYYASLANTGKHVMGNVYFPENVEKVFRLAALVAGGTDSLLARPIVSFITSFISAPLTFNAEVCPALLEIVRRGMPVALSSVAIAGLTAPVTFAGTLAITHAEQLAGITLCQLANPGAPVIYGGCPGVADMRDTSFCPGSIERQILNAAVTQLARHVGVPNYNLAGVTDSKIPDIQAGYEKAFGICLSVLAGSNYIHHAAGRIADGVAYEQYVIDNEIILMARRAVRGIEVSGETLAVDDIISAGPGGDFISREHTLKHFRDEFFFPAIADRRERAAWEAAGSPDARERARVEARRILHEHVSAPIPERIDRRIRDEFEILLPA